MSNVRMKTVVTRYRGDGRAITQQVPEPTDIYAQALHRMQGKSHIQRQLGKAAALGAMYGMRTRQMSNYQARRMFEMNGNRSARDPTNGPFKVEVYQGKRQFVRSAGHKVQAYKVVNKNGYRVHRGTMRSCNDVCDNLNVEYAKWLMVKPDEPSPSLFIDLETTAPSLIGVDFAQMEGRIYRAMRYQK